MEEYSLTVAIVLLTMIFSFLVYYYYYMLSSKSTKHKLLSPPEAGGAWPLTGHLHLMGGGSSSKLPHITLAAMADKYGPIFTIRLGIHRALIVSNFELAKEIFTRYDVAVSSRPKLKAAKHLGYNFAMFGFSPYGPYWRELRKVVSLELLSSRRIELLRDIRVSEISQSINELYKLWEEKKDGSGRVSVEMKQWFGDLNLNVILRMVTGKRFFDASDDRKEARRCRVVMRDFFYLAGLFVAADAMPFLGWLDLGGYEKKMKETAKELDELIENWLEEHKKNNEFLDNSSKPKDFMDVMLSAVETANIKDQFDSDTIIKSTCSSLIVGGSDTTSVMLVWALSLLLNNPHVLKRAQQELDIQIGKERRVNESDLNNLVYLQAIIKETLRLYPAGPLSVTREFSQNCTIGGHHVAKGTWLMVNLYKLQRDPRAWPDDPLEFKPDRFLTTHKNTDVKGQDFELIPFGAGRRICPGANLGLQMLQLVLANLLQGFEISTKDNELVDMTESAGLTNIKATPLDVLLAPRLSPNLY
ncbi:hypothetical protein ACJIZ3_007368 [Penstemon smallii]|uniref:Flavonoid-6-hydroxylase n=1 Tax=Penstemon smallii TaxID=265156 RepID=A0ABD3SAL5_9LAMI